MGLEPLAPLTPFRLDGLALGGFIAVVVRQPDQARERALAAVSLLAALGMSASLAVADLSHELFGRRFLRMKRRFETAKPPALIVRSPQALNPWAPAQRGSRIFAPRGLVHDMFSSCINPE